ncbi:MAG: hypothetical protein ACP5N0_02100 [Methanosarcina sp.]|jgi:hypothetical protein
MVLKMLGLSPGKKITWLNVPGTKITSKATTGELYSKEPIIENSIQITA